MAQRKPPLPPSLRRRGPSREPNIALLIFCEGENTEPSYLASFAREHGNQLVRIKVVAPAGVPMTIVNKAKEARVRVSKSKDSFEKFDQVWAVFDRDAHPSVPQALEEARAAGVEVGYSNPCFEVWLILHHDEFDAPDDRHEVQRRYKSFDEHYDPKGSKMLNYAALSAGYDAAKKRAQAMRARRVKDGEPKSEPYTDIDVLTELIVENGRGRTPK